MIKKLGICVPYRDREYHLKMLINFILHIKQMIGYSIEVQ